MADPPVTVYTLEQLAAQKAYIEGQRLSKDATEQSTNATLRQLDVNTNLGTSLTGLQQHLETNRNAFSEITAKLNIFSKDQQGNIKITEAQREAFAGLSTVLFGVQTRFHEFSGVSVTGLNTLSGTIDQISKMAPGKLDSVARALLPASVVAAFSKGAAGIEQAKAAINAFATSADNAARLQNAMIQAAGKAGTLPDLYKAAGDGMEGMNATLQKQAEFFGNVSDATGFGVGQVAKYWHEFAQIPKVMIDGKNSLDQLVGGQHLLTAALQVASGTGRDQSEVIQEMKHSMVEYNMSGEKALTFSARMTELSGALAVPLDKMQGALKGVADRFKLVGDNTEGASKMFLTYVEALKSTGISGAAALDIVKNMTEALGGMNIAQKAFLSAQSGGAGGLMGGFQIEKMMREGKMDQVMDMVKKQMKQQFGRIVTLDEASKSQEAASQMQRQVMMLKQGPLGPFAEKPEQAYRLLEGMKGLETGKVTPKQLQENVLKGTMDQGVKLQQLQLTELQKISRAFESAAMFRDIVNRGMIQKGFGALAGQMMGEGEGENIERQAKLRGYQEQGGKKAGAVGRGILEAQTNRSDIILNNIVKNFGDVFTDMGNIIKTKVMTMRKSFIGGAKPEEQTKTLEAFHAELDVQRKKANLIKDVDKRKAAQAALDEERRNIDQEFNLHKQTAYQAKTTKPTTALAPTTTKKGNAADFLKKDMTDRYGEATTAGAEVGAAVEPSTIATRAASTAAEIAADEKATAGKGVEAPSQVDVRITGYCIDCGKPMEPTSQTTGLNPSTRK